VAGSGDINIVASMDVSAFESALKRMDTGLKSMSKGVADMSKSLGTSSKDTSGSIDQTTKSVEDLGKQTKKVSHDELPSLRYALYDVANSATRVQNAFGGIVKGAVEFSTQYESAFTNVERTTLSNVQLLDSIRTQLLGLSQQIPMTFGDISGIASLGAQLGIATGDLGAFSKTVAQFSAVTNVSTDTAAQSFGAIGELLNVTAADYDKLGSAIASVGVNSIATEAEILSVATAIGGVANSSGLSADYVVGLSGALASLRIPSEQSRGALTRIFQEVNRSAAGSGVAMSQFAQILGITTAEAQKLATSDLQTFFTKFVNGLSGLNTTQLTTTLDALNLADIRVTNVLTRLSRNTDLFSKSLADSGSAYKDGSFLAAVYALKVDDLSSKFTMLQNSVQNFAAQMGSVLTPVLGPVVDFLREIVNNVNAALQTGAGKVFAGMAVGAAALVASLAGLVAILATATASIFALRFAINNLGWTSAMGGARGLAAALFGVTAAEDAATAGANRLKIGLVSTGIGAVVVLLGTLVALLMAAGDAANSASGQFLKVVGDTGGLSDALVADTQAYQQAIQDGNAGLAASFQAVQYAGTSLGDKYGETARKVGEVAKITGTDVTNAFNYASSSIDQNTRYIGANTEAWYKNKLMQSEVFQNLAGKSGMADYFNAIGFDFSQAIAAASDNGTQGVYDYFQSLSIAALNGGRITRDQLAAVDQTLLFELDNTNKLAANVSTDGFWVWYNNIVVWARQFMPFLADLMNGIANLFGVDIGNATKDVANQFGGLAEQASIMELQFGKAGTTGSNALDSIGSSASKAAAKVYLLTDYSNDLSSIWKRAFDIRFAGETTLDSINSKWNKMREDVKAARDEMDSLNVDINGLTADKKLQEYWLSVAVAMGDTMRADQIRADMAKTDKQLADKNKALAAAQAKTNKTIDDNTDAGIANRTELRGLVTDYESYIAALASSGLKGKALTDAVAKAKDKFYENGLALGYTKDQLDKYALGFDDVNKAIKAVPRKLTVDFNGDAALTAIKEWIAKANTAAGGLTSSPSVGAGATASTAPKVSSDRQSRGKNTTISAPGGKGFWNDMWGGWNGMWSDITKNWNGFWGGVGLNWDNMWSSFSKGWDGMWETVKTGWSNMWNSFNTNPVVQFIGKLGTALSTDIGNWIRTSLVGPIITGWNTISSTISTGWNNLWNTVTTWWTTNIQPAINTAFGFIKIAWESATGAISTWWQQKVIDPITNTIGVIKDKWDTWLRVFKSGWDNTIKDVTGWFKQYISDPIGSAIGAVQKAWDTLVGKLSNAGKSVASWINSILPDWVKNTETYKLIQPLLKKLLGFAEGGYTGAGGKYDVAGIVHRGEYVVPKAQVNQTTGLPYYMMNQTRTFAQGGYAGSPVATGPMMVELSPYDRNLLAQAGNVQLRLDGRIVAQNTNANNTVAAQRGSN
jgi:TP901 family phage tail tape measure protein